MYYHTLARLDESSIFLPTFGWWAGILKALLSHLDQPGDVAISDIECLLLKLDDLYKTSNKAIDAATKAGLKNRTLTGSALQKFICCNDRLCDAIERFELSLNPAVAEALRDSIKEYERGETVSLNSLV